MGYLSNGVTSGGIPMHIVNAFLSAGTPIKYFVETGTQGGESMKAVRGLFPEAYTIEIMEGKDYGVAHNGHSESYIIGDSVEVLPDLIKKFDDSWALFWLDAHYSGSEPNNTGHEECPLMKEIDAVGKYCNSIVIVDDIRLFLGFSMWPLDNRFWPKIDDIIFKLKMAFPQNFVTILDDYLVMIPEQFRDALDKEWRDRYSIRYPSADEVKRLAYRAAYIDIMKNFDYLKTWLNV